jgi:hypothetical protein
MFGSLLALAANCNCQIGACRRTVRQPSISAPERARLYRRHDSRLLILCRGHILGRRAPSFSSARHQAAVLFAGNQGSMPSRGFMIAGNDIAKRARTLSESLSRSESRTNGEQRNAATNLPAARDMLAASRMSEGETQCRTTRAGGARQGTGHASGTSSRPDSPSPIPGCTRTYRERSPAPRCRRSQARSRVLSGT